MAGKHGDAFIDLVKSEETKMRGKEIKEEITQNEFRNQQDCFLNFERFIREETCEHAPLK